MNDETYLIVFEFDLIRIQLASSMMYLIFLIMPRTKPTQPTVNYT